MKSPKEIADFAKELIDNLGFTFDLETSRYENGKVRKFMHRNHHWKAKDYPMIGEAIRDGLLGFLGEEVK